MKPASHYHRTVPCPCGKDARLVLGDAIYPHRADLHTKQFYLCDCGRYVGCHSGTAAPLGAPADQETRAARNAAHAAFDPLWRNGTRQIMTRTEAYAWLARALGIGRDKCHIGMFDAATCRRVVELCAIRRAAR